MQKRTYKKWNDGERRVVEVMKSSGYTPEDIAHQLGRSVGSVKGVFYGMNRSAKVVEEEPKPTFFQIIMTILGLRK